MAWGRISAQNLTGGSEATYKVLDSTVELQGAATIRGYIRGQVDFNLYAVAGPYFGVKPYLDFTAMTNRARSRIDWSLHAGVDGYAGVQAAIFDKIGLGENFASVSWDFNFFEYPLKTGRLRLVARRSILFIAAVFQFAFSPNGRYIATGDDEGYLTLWEVSSGTNLWRKRLGGEVESVAFSPDGRYIAADGYDGRNTSVIIWDVSSGTRIRQLSAGNVFAIAFRPDGRYIAAGDTDGIITFWRTDGWLREKQIRTGAVVTDLAWNPGSNLISDGKKVYRPLLSR